MLLFRGRQTDVAYAGLPGDHDPLSLTDSFKDTAVVQLDLTGSIVNLNSVAEQVFGCPATGLVARSCATLLPSEASHGRAGAPLRAALDKGLFQIAGWTKRIDGTRFWAETQISPLTDPGQRVIGFMAVVRDTTELKRRIDSLRAALEVSIAVLGDHPLEKHLEVVVHQARSLLHADGAQVALPVEGGNKLTIPVASGWNAPSLLGVSWPGRGSMIARVIRSGHSRMIDGVPRALPGHEPLARQFRVGPTLAVPLAWRRREIGALLVYNRVQGPKFHARDLELLSRFARQAALSIHHATTQPDQLRTIAKERERLARFVRSEAVQPLRPLGRRLCEAMAGCQDPIMREQLARGIATIEGAVEELRNVALGRPPRLLEDHRLDEALLVLARDHELRAGAPTTVEMQAEAAERLTEHAGDVIQIVREALSNVNRHARARHCRLRLQLADSETRLEIEDDGVGFDPRRLRGRGAGLHHLRERVARMGGKLRIETAPGAGTALRVAIPRGGSGGGGGGGGGGPTVPPKPPAGLVGRGSASWAVKGLP